MSEDQKSARDIELETLQAKADETNSGRTGKGTRVRVGQTRGKNPKVITWEAFDTEKPETLPSDLSQFMELTKVNDEPLIVSYLIDGYNSAQYSAASDILSEYVEANWPDSLVKQFKATVTNFSASAGISIEDAVEVIKPSVVKAFNARLAASQAVG